MDRPPSNPAAPSRWRGASARALVLVLVALGAWTSCAGRASPPPAAAGVKPTAPQCQRDEAREFFCDDFLPPSAALPAAAPFESCPSSVDHPPSEYEPAPTIGLFDSSYTEYTRRRAPPGHACCYSWCHPVQLADPASPEARAACAKPSAFREEYCMPELEGGTALPVAPPYDRCPAAIAPPKQAVFAAPAVAPFDGALTAAHRAKGQAECCYAWCSQAPAGSGILERTGRGR